jgi:hypothetical protein
LEETESTTLAGFLFRDASRLAGLGQLGWRKKQKAKDA